MAETQIVRNAIVRSTVKAVFPIIFIFGLYVAFHGHLSPGGGFPAGVILATGFILLMIAFKDEIKAHELIDLKTVAGVMLVILFVEEYILRTDLMKTQTPYHLWSGGVTILLNIVGVMMGFTAMSLIVYAMVKE